MNAPLRSANPNVRWYHQAPTPWALGYLNYEAAWERRRLVAEAFVLDKRALVDQAGVDIEGVGQCPTGHADLNTPVRILKHLHVLADQSPVVRGVDQHVELALVVQEQFSTDLQELDVAEGQGTK
jgi:hypothetical protein